MIRKIMLGALLVALLQGAIASSAVAQAPSACTVTFVWFFPDPIPPGAVCGPGEGPFSMLCTGSSGKCPPAVWCPTCGTFVPTAGKPINLTNGNTYIQQNDVRIPGLGNGLSLDRTWNSMSSSALVNSSPPMFGLGWRSTYEERLIVGSGVLTNYMVYARADGSFWIFGTSNGTAYTVGAPANINAGLAQSGTQWVLTFQNGDKRIFSSSNGSLLSIVDRNGNTTQLTYDGLNRLIGVADAAGRHLNFTYVNGTSSSPVAAATSDVGLSLSYAYDTQGRLTTVTRPDLSTYNFAYNAQSLINAVTDAQGKVLESHTYDSNGRGLTSSRAAGVDAVTVVYPQ